MSKTWPFVSSRERCEVGGRLATTAAGVSVDQCCPAYPPCALQQKGSVKQLWEKGSGLDLRDWAARSGRRIHILRVHHCSMHPRWPGAAGQLTVVAKTLSVAVDADRETSRYHQDAVPLTPKG